MIQFSFHIITKEIGERERERERESLSLKKSAFTLLEIMIVISIIGILAASLFPSMTPYLKRSRDAARVSHISQLGVALASYHIDKEIYPPHESGCAPYTSLTGAYIRNVRSLISPSGSGYDEGCGNNGYYAYGVSTGVANATITLPSILLMAHMENTFGGNYSGSTLGMTGDLTSLGAWNATTNISKGSGSIYILYNGGGSGSISGGNGGTSPPPSSINGQCDTISYSCNTGTPSGYVAGSCGGNETWNCLGSNGGTNASCSNANPLCSINGQCNNSVQYACTTGTSVSNVAGSCGGSSTWGCAGTNGGTSTTATACSKANAVCAPSCNSTYGTSGGTCYCSSIPSGSVWGSSPYTNDSNICIAAKHAGATIPGNVTVVTTSGCSTYASTTQNGVTTSSYGPWAGSYYISGYGATSCGGGTPVVNGICDNTTQYACTSGTSVSNVAGSCGGTSTWGCNGSNGGTSTTATACSKANTACVVNSCITPQPNIPNATFTQNPTSPNQAWSYNITPGSCTYKCNPGYTWNGNACVAEVTCVDDCAGVCGGNAVDYNGSANGCGPAPHWAYEYSTTGDSAHCGPTSNPGWPGGGTPCTTLFELYKVIGNDTYVGYDADGSICGSPNIPMYTYTNYFYRCIP